jgi:signal transduction histidine kinase
VTSPRSPSLAQLRVRLTLWYAGTFALILLLLGAGLLFSIRLQMTQRLDTSLAGATAAVMRATRDYEAERAAGVAADAVEELHIPDRDLYLFDAHGRPITPPQADDWIQAAAGDAARAGSVNLQRESSRGHNHEIRLHAERFTTPSGTTYVAAAVAARPNIGEQYASLIGTFAGAALAALVLVAVGGFLLARKSTLPVERSMEQMRRFMADAAHELRTPVAVLRARAEVALAHARDADRDDATLRAFVGESDRLGAIVGDLLTLARADAGERAVAREPLYLDDLAADAIEAARALAQRKGVALEVGSFDEARIIGDPALVRRLVLIVLDNAIKYTPSEGHVRIDVTAADGARSVVVTDSGIGIPAEQLPRIFERFYRGDRARHEAEGAGLGLTIAQWISELHGAHLVFSSGSPGTRVAIEFPAAV